MCPRKASPNWPVVSPGDVVTIPVGHLVHEAVPDALTEAVSAFLLTDAAPVSTDRT